MPFHDSEYPSIIRGREKRESQRLLAAAPELLDALKGLLDQLDAIGIPDWHGAEGLSLESSRSAIAKAEGRGA